MIEVPADFHIHIGSTKSGKPVKITASRSMTFSSILQEASRRKGLEMIGLIDAHVPEVQEEIEEGIQNGRFQELASGGIRFEQTTCLLGVEIEVRAETGGLAHLLVYLPSLEQMKSFTDWLSCHMKNIHLSTQRLYQSAEKLLEKVEELGGILLPAHAFTPFKSLFGSAVNHLDELLPPERIFALELGLSSDSKMADQLSELREITFLSNSDAHSTLKIAREYQILSVKEANYTEFVKALKREDGRKVLANYGFPPKLGKYYRTTCFRCGAHWQDGCKSCPRCQSEKYIRGVKERLEEISDQPTHSPKHRPPYIYQIPLLMLPGIGPKTLSRLIEKVGTEMYLLHRATEKELIEASNHKVAKMILQSRAGEIQIIEGGGGIYGKVQ